MDSTKSFSLVINSEQIFMSEDFGKPIDKGLSTILRRNASKEDFANIAIKSNVSFSTIRDVVYRTNSLTKANAKAISLLIYTAYENSIATKIQAEGDILFLNELLKF